VGLFVCFSGASNTGTLTGMAALEVVKRLGNEIVGICSLPAVLNRVARQSGLVKQIEKLMVIDGCHNACARQLLAEKGIKPDLYLNLEADLNITKIGPFSSLTFNNDEVNQIAQVIAEKIKLLIREGN
jgi:uncharacterized metal-binding protein